MGPAALTSTIDQEPPYNFGLMWQKQGTEHRKRALPCLELSKGEGGFRNSAFQNAGSERCRQVRRTDRLLNHEEGVHAAAVA